MPVWTKLEPRETRLTILLFPQFSHYCLANTLEPFRAANTLLGRMAYRWQVVTLDGAPVASSSGLPITPETALSEARGEMLFLLPSYGYAAWNTPATRRSLRAAATRHGLVAGLDTGAWLMAGAGLLEGRKATIHYDEFDAFAEAFPAVTATRARWLIEGDRATAAGALAALELVLHQIGEAHGTALTLEIASLFMHHEAGVLRSVTRAGGDRVVSQALAAMEAALEYPMPIPTLAATVRTSPRDLEQRFARVLGASPRTVYRRLRLTRARRLLADTALSVTEIGHRCGYGDASAFARAFRREFGMPPRALR